jgi:RHS repeat-associated protein
LGVCGGQTSRIQIGYKLRFKQLATNRQYDLHTTQYTYDSLSRLVDADVYLGINLNAVADRAYDYAYDPAGNRTQQVVTLDGVQDSSLTYTYNALNQLTSDGANSYTYNANGNLIKTNGQTTHTYDRANRLLSYGGSSYAYDGQGNRVSQTVDSVVTQYLLDVQPELATVLAATTGQDTTRYLHGPLGLQSQHQPDDSWAFPLVDGLGSMRGVVNEDLSHLESRQYTPYGEVYGTTGAEQTTFGFTGEPVDTNGLVHLRARYYDPVMGRFLNMDPSWTEANLYQYGLANPITNRDPSGYWPLSDRLAECACFRNMDVWLYLDCLNGNGLECPRTPSGSNLSETSTTHESTTTGNNGIDWTQFEGLLQEILDAQLPCRVECWDWGWDWGCNIILDNPFPINQGLIVYPWTRLDTESGSYGINWWLFGEHLFYQFQDATSLPETSHPDYAYGSYNQDGTLRQIALYDENGNVIYHIDQPDATTPYWHIHEMLEPGMADSGHHGPRGMVGGENGGRWEDVEALMSELGFDEVPWRRFEDYRGGYE